YRRRYRDGFIRQSSRQPALEHEWFASDHSHHSLFLRSDSAILSVIELDFSRPRRPSSTRRSLDTATGVSTEKRDVHLCHRALQEGTLSFLHDIRQTLLRRC